MKISRILPSIFITLTLLGTVSGYPELEYYVTDQAGVLLMQDIYDIEDLCYEVDTATGAEIAVLIVPTTSPDTIESYAVKTFEKSGIGEEGKDNGLLLLIAVDDRAWRIEVGYGLEGILPDLKVNEIADTHLTPYLVEFNYYEGILYTVAELGIIIVENYTGPPPEEEEGPWQPISFLPLNWWQLLIAVSVTIFVLILTGGRIFLWVGGSFGGGRGGFGGGRSGGGGSSGRF